jgi:hypothetical protein
MLLVVFLMMGILTWVRWNLSVVLICNFFMARDGEHFFMYFWPFEFLVFLNVGNNTGIHPSRNPIKSVVYMQNCWKNLKHFIVCKLLFRIIFHSCFICIHISLTWTYRCFIFPIEFYP